MTEHQVKTRMTPSGARLIVSVVAASCVLVALATPTPIEPAELPALVVTDARDARSLATLKRLAAHAPTDALGRALERELAFDNRSEVGAGETSSRAQARRMAIVRAREAVQRAHGDSGLAALRARATLAAEDAFRGRVPPARIDAVLGGFGTVLAAYDAADEAERRVLAPMFVVRTLYAARWNAQVGLPALTGLDPDERRAYFGWLALESAHAPSSMRIDALASYGREGGAGYDEARAIYLYREGRFIEARRAFAKLYDATQEIRYRNYALAAGRASEGDR